MISLGSPTIQIINDENNAPPISSDVNLLSPAFEGLAKVPHFASIADGSRRNPSPASPTYRDRPRSQ